MQLLQWGGARAGRWGLLWACAAGWGMAAHAKDPGAWQLVQPMTRPYVGNAVAQHFARWLPQYLGERVEVHVASRNQGMDALTWAAYAASPERTLVLHSALWARRWDELQAPGEGADNVHAFSPLQMVYQGTWCLLAKSGREFADAAALQAWLRTLGRPVRLGVPHNFGAPELWARAMAQKTGLVWMTQSFQDVAKSLPALVEGRADLVLERCGDVARWMRGPALGPYRRLLPVQVLARVGRPEPLPAPTFSQWQLPSLTPGWVAWFAPANMSALQQARAAKALHAVMLRPDTQALIAKLQQDPARSTPQASQTALRRAQADGRELQQWLDDAANPLLDMRELEAWVP